MPITRIEPETLASLEEATDKTDVGTHYNSGIINSGLEGRL
jgi:hypothetical protein